MDSPFAQNGSAGLPSGSEEFTIQQQWAWRSYQKILEALPLISVSLTAGDTIFLP